LLKQFRECDPRSSRWSEEQRSSNDGDDVYNPLTICNTHN
jgi:hypothetical protein